MEKTRADPIQDAARRLFAGCGTRPQRAAALVLAGLAIMSLRLLDIRADLADLRDSALPRLVKLAQLSQEASATSSFAPALSIRPSQSELETLLSRIKDKEASQRALIEELAALFEDEGAARTLRENGALLIGNLQTLTAVVREQIAVSKRLEAHGERFRALLRRRPRGGRWEPGADGEAALETLAEGAALAVVSALLDPNRARFARNRRAIEARIGELAARAGGIGAAAGEGSAARVAGELVALWSAEQERILADKGAELANEFRIKALAEENSLIASRLLSSATNAFWRASADLEAQIRGANETARFTLAAVLGVVAAFGAGMMLVGYVLRRRVFLRRDRIRDALRSFAETRSGTLADTGRDEIGENSGSLARYMAVIDEREAELAAKSAALEQLSNQLAKYLPPQVYDSIFSGRQKVKVASSRKKLTIFFSDIVGFTEAADRLESEELTQLLNHYLTEMSQIALDHGATIDKYVGDAILIFFGVPESRGEKADALACVQMAIAMRRRMRELEDVWREAGIGKPPKVRMGIHTGFCTVGNFGSEDRLDYTIIGSAVNIAARLEELAAPGEILISFETFAHVNDAVLCEEAGEVEVRGVAHPVATWRVVDSYANLGRERRRFAEEHAHLRLELDLEAMAAEDRHRAARILRRGLALIDNAGEREPPERGG